MRYHSSLNAIVVRYTGKVRIGKVNSARYFSWKITDVRIRALSVHIEFWNSWLMLCWMDECK